MSCSILRPVPSHPGYFASDAGDIWTSHPRGGSRRPSSSPSPLRKLAGYVGKDGYVRFCLRGGRPAYGHRMVAEAFHGPCPAGCQTRHLNGVRTDNRPDNVAWGTPAQNASDRRKHQEEREAAAPA